MTHKLVVSTSRSLESPRTLDEIDKLVAMSLLSSLASAPVPADLCEALVTDDDVVHYASLYAERYRRRLASLEHDAILAAKSLGLQLDERSSGAGCPPSTADENRWLSGC